MPCPPHAEHTAKVVTKVPTKASISLFFCPLRPDPAAAISIVGEHKAANITKVISTGNRSYVTGTA